MRIAFSMALVLLVVGAIGTPTSAQQRGVSLVNAQQADSAIPGHDVISIVVDFAPGGTTGLITHPTDMVGYVVSGAVVLEQEGIAPRLLDTGANFIVPAGVVYSHTNHGAAVARMHATYVLDKTKALTRPMHASARR